jgi:hypothetical protein
VPGKGADDTGGAVEDIERASALMAGLSGRRLRESISYQYQLAI